MVVPTKCEMTPTQKAFVKVLSEELSGIQVVGVLTNRKTNHEDCCLLHRMAKTEHQPQIPMSHGLQRAKSCKKPKLRQIWEPALGFLTSGAEPYAQTEQSWNSEPACSLGSLSLAPSLV